MAQDLRQLMADLEAAGELVRLREPISPAGEVAALARELNLRGGPACLLEQVGGSSLPLLVNLWGSRGRVARALGVAVGELCAEWNRRLDLPLRPEVVGGPASCREVDAASSLDVLPLCTWNDREQPYLTFAVAVYRDPERGKWNAGFYRAMRLDERTLTLRFGGHRPLARLWSECEARGEPLPVALVLGAPPAVQLAACAPLPAEVDEYAVAGALQGSPLALARCATGDLLVPAEAEVVLAGELVPGRREVEGPFGDYFGVYDPPEAVPCWRLQSVTHRRGAVCQAVNSGFPPTENALFEIVPIEHALVRSLGPAAPVRAFRFWETSCRTVGVLGLSRPADGRRLGEAALATPQGRYLKLVVVVGPDVDVYADHEVAWAVATRLDAARDLHLLHDAETTRFDPAVDPERRAAGDHRIGKAVLDTTRHPAVGERALPDPAARRRVLERFGHLLRGAGR